MKNFPLVSIIIPTHNRSALLKKAINSVIEQTYSNIEILIIDDCSTDNTKEVVLNLKEHHSIPVFYHRNKTNIGAAASRNRGIIMANGSLVTFLDDDDQYLKTKVENQLKLWKNHPNALIYCGMNIYSETKNYKSSLKYKGNVYKRLLQDDLTGTPTFFLKKAIAQKHLFDEQLPACQDWDFALRIAKNHPFYFVKKHLINVYVQKNSIGQSPKAIKGLEMFYQKHIKNYNFWTFLIVAARHLAFLIICLLNKKSCKYLLSKLSIFIKIYFKSKFERTKK